MTLKINSIRKLITDNVTDLTSTSLTLIDASKLPRDLYLQIIESDLLLKKKNKNFVTNISPKPNIDANDVFSLLKSFIKESDYFTFNFATESNVDEIAKNINKVHKFLKGNSSSYLQKCIIDYSWRAIYSSSDEEFDKNVSEMLAKCKEYDPDDQCLNWCLNEAALRCSYEDQVR